MPAYYSTICVVNLVVSTQKYNWSMSTKVDERKGLTLDGCIPTSDAASYAVTFARHLSDGKVSSIIEDVTGKSITDGWSQRLLRRRKRPVYLKRPFAACLKK